jgi:hypothetical protein
MFFWKNARDTQHEGIGLTRDIGVRGVFVFTTSPPPLESDIKLNAYVLPGRRLAPPLRMHLRGRVVRVETACGGKLGAGFAVAGKRLILRGGEEYR